MARLQSLEATVPTRAMAGLLSVALHVGLLVLVAVAGGRRDGIYDDDTPLTRVVYFDSDVSARREGIDRAPWTPAMPHIVLGARPALEFLEPSIETVSEPELSPDGPIHPEQEQEREQTEPASDENAVLDAAVTASPLVMSETQAVALLRQLERLAAEMQVSTHSRVSWQHEGREYEAELVPEPARDGTEPDRIIAEVSAENLGRWFKTRIVLTRLPFSHYAQVIDQWDPMVQLHDDEIIGRMHINSRFNVLYDSQAIPRFVGKVSTSARGFNLDSHGARRSSEVFREGIETGAERIPLLEQQQLMDRARADAGARVHELTTDTRIRFLGDRGYTWDEPKSGTTRYADPPGDESVYFIARRGVTVHVQGVVSGRFLVYSPQRIVVEGSLTCARDPRRDQESGDFIGLVSDKDIELARRWVTGGGDLHIQAALYARRRFLIRDTGHSRTATLSIYGSLTAGSLTESEPRFAWRVEYDPRFERIRPPAFPSTNRFAAEGWEGQWTEMSAPTASAGL